ncbi:MAG: c-type cytochrome [Pseudomonadales bacterium]
MRWLVLVGLMSLTGMLAGCGNAEGPASGEQAAAHPGEQIYTRFCFSCHAAGIAGAPRVGDPQAWAPRIARGREALVTATIEGIPPGMPPRGLCARCSDEELELAVDFMIERSL